MQTKVSGIKRAAGKEFPKPGSLFSTDQIRHNRKTEAIARTLKCPAAKQNINLSKKDPYLIILVSHLKELSRATSNTRTDFASIIKERIASIC